MGLHRSLLDLVIFGFVCPCGRVLITRGRMLFLSYFWICRGLALSSANNAAAPSLTETAVRD
jgi:hypothetical protein